MWTPGTVLNEFRLLEFLGEGGFGQVWLAENQMAVGDEPRQVALKIPHHQDKEVLEVADWLAGFRHPNIVQLYRRGRTQAGLIFLVLEYVAGGSLESRLRREGKLPEEEATRVACEVLDALEYLHNKRCIHADVKPANILMDPAGRAKLSDFGLARLVPPEKSYVRFEAGTGPYMAPEVWRGEVRLASSDLWAMGVVLHQMLTGRLPFRAQTPEHLMVKILSEQPTLAEGLSALMREVMEKALAKQPAERYASPAAMKAALESAALFGVDTSRAWETKNELLRDPRTVLIVVRRWASIEIDDRPPAELIQAHLMRTGRMALILTDVCYLEKREEFENHPVIAVGGPDGNAVTRELNVAASVDAEQHRALGSRVVRVIPSTPPKALVWGGWAQDTLLATIDFLKTEVTHFLEPDPPGDLTVLSPHLNDAFLLLGGAIANWKRSGKRIRVVDVFSSTNYSWFHVSGGGEETATLTRWRKVEELAAARLSGARVVFLDLPEALLRTRDWNQVWVLDEPDLNLEPPALASVKAALEPPPGAECLFPLGLSRHRDHLLIRNVGIELLRAGKVRRACFYEDIWPPDMLEGGLRRRMAECGIRGAPDLISQMMERFGIHIQPRWEQIDIRETLRMAAVYYAECRELRGLLAALEKHFRHPRDGRHYCRYWEAQVR